MGNTEANETSLKAYIEDQYQAFDSGDAERIDGGWFIGYGFRSSMPRADIEEEMRLAFTQLLSGAFFSPAPQSAV